jgi:hypothetical protein
MSQAFEWTTEPLSAEDQKLVDAYRTIGRSLDDLPYTADFEKLRVAVGADDTQDAKHALFKRLLTLRKTGRLPRASLAGY